MDIEKGRTLTKVGRERVVEGTFSTEILVAIIYLTIFDGQFGVIDAIVNSGSMDGNS